MEVSVNGRPAAGNEASGAPPSLLSASGSAASLAMIPKLTRFATLQADPHSTILEWPAGSFHRLSPLERLARLRGHPARRKAGPDFRYLPWQSNEKCNKFT